MLVRAGRAHAASAGWTRPARPAVYALVKRQAQVVLHPSLPRPASYGAAPVAQSLRVPFAAPSLPPAAYTSTANHQVPRSVAAASKRSAKPMGTPNPARRCPIQVCSTGPSISPRSRAPKALFHRPTSTEQAHATRSLPPLKARSHQAFLAISSSSLKRLVLFVVSGIRLHGAWPPQKSRRAERLPAIIVSCKRLAVL